MDNNPETGDYAENSHGNYEAWMYLYLFGGTPEAPAFWESPKGDGKPSSSVIADVLCKGTLDDNPEEDGLIETEVRIPRANLPAVEKGQTMSFDNILQSLCIIGDIHIAYLIVVALNNLSSIIGSPHQFVKWASYNVSYRDGHINIHFL